jgi:hypothetical protein
MSNLTRTNDLQGDRPVATKKDWKKPMLDILELESAQAGISHLQDGRFTHHSS